MLTFLQACIVEATKLWIDFLGFNEKERTIFDIFKT